MFDKQRKEIKGFTLIELMIGVAIIGILTTIAYPSYLDYVTRSNRSEALRELMFVAGLEEQFYIDNHTYTANMGDLFPGAGTTINTDHGWYVISAIISNGGANFTLTATPQDTSSAQQATNDTSCQSLSIDQTGRKTASNGASTDTTSICWTK
jgi:type IV pilus assembly protein PilE